MRTMRNKPDITAIDARALEMAPEILARLFPSGWRSTKWTFTASLGGEGTGLKVGLKDGKWFDVDYGVDGQGLTALVAALDECELEDAARRLENEFDLAALEGGGEDEGDEPGGPDEDFPLIPLGHRQGIYYFLSPDGEMLEAQAERINEGMLDKLFGGETRWMLRHFQKVNRQGDKVLAVTNLRRWLIRRCRREGLFDPFTPERGLGVWPDGKGGVLCHCGDGIWIDGQWRRAGIKRGDAIYPASWRIDRPANREATLADAATLVEAVGRWQFEEEWGADMWLGFLGQSYLGAAPDWRAHLFVIGQFGTGKSALANLMAVAQGGGAHPMLNSYTAASLRQAMTTQARTMILDEAEPNDSAGYRIKAVIEMIRHMSSGAGMRATRGTPGGVAQGFSVNGSAYLSAISRGHLKPQDKSRITTIILKKLPRGTEFAKSRDRMLALTAKVAKLSGALRRRAIQGWPRYEESFRIWREVLLSQGADSRAADQPAALLAGRDVLLRDDVVSLRDAYDEAAARLTGLIFDAEAIVDEEGADCLDAILTAPAESWGGGARAVVGELVMQSFEKNGLSARKTLEAMGLRVDAAALEQRCMFVATTHAALLRVFRGTRWEDGSWADALGYLDGAERRARAYFTGRQKACVRIPGKYLPVAEGGGEGDSAERQAAEDALAKTV